MRNLTNPYDRRRFLDEFILLYRVIGLSFEDVELLLAAQGISGS
jgi:hypothetical protein